MPDNAEPIYAIATDKEQATGTIALIFKQDALPEELAASMGKILMDMSTSVVTSVLNERLNELANKPGDGSAREQAASCQKVLGGDANICYEYATKRYRSNCINWGIVPFTIARETPFDYVPGDMVFVPGIRKAMEEGKEEIDAQVITKDGVKPIHLYFNNLGKTEREVLLAGCLMNYYAKANKK